MTSSRITGTSGITAALDAMNRRDRALDPQLPDRSFDASARLLVSEQGGAVRAAGASTVEILRPGDPGAIWGAARRASLELRWDGDEAGAGELLDDWIAEAGPELAGADAGADSGAGDWDSSLSLRLPSRDSALVRPMLSRGFAVTGVEGIRIGARGADAAGAAERLRAAGVSVRPAGPADLDLLAELDTELLAHDAQHGGVTPRPGATGILRDGIAQRLAADPEWTWILEQDGAPAGYLSIETGKDRHRERLAPGGSIAFIQAMYLRPGVRGGGLGEAVVEFGHGQLEGAGFDRILLDYAALNPRSGPFWCRMGYRPLWNTWQRRPALLARR